MIKRKQISWETFFEFNAHPNCLKKNFYRFSLEKQAGTFTPTTIPENFVAMNDYNLATPKFLGNFGCPNFNTVQNVWLSGSFSVIDCNLKCQELEWCKEFFIKSNECALYGSGCTYAASAVWSLY